VLHDDGDAVCVGIDERVEIVVGDLLERAVAQQLVVAERASQVVQVSSSERVH